VDTEDVAVQASKIAPERLRGGSIRTRSISNCCVQCSPTPRKNNSAPYCTGQEQGDGGCLMQVSSGREARGKPF